MVLLIDNYDSFTYNLYQYIGEFDNDIKVYRNDVINSDEIIKINPDRIVISPGPKSPKDAGNCVEIIKNISGKIPILGICLGHQCIGYAFGGEISNAKELFHGKSSIIEHNQKGIFKNAPNPMQVARYHSLEIVKETLPECLEIISELNGEIMAVKHKEYNTIGLQFHPESIYTPDGKILINNFIKGEF